MTLASFFSVLGVVWVSQALTRIDFATGSGQSIAAFLELLGYLTPQLISLVLPFAVVIGTVQVFNTMNSDSELAVISASGVARGSVAIPVLAIAGLASAWLLVSNHFIEPAANRAVRQLVTAARSELITSVLREGVFKEVTPGLTIYIDKRLPGNQLGGIMVSDKREDNLDLIYYAQAGAVGKVDDKDVLVMNNGQIQRKDTRSDTLSIIRFNSYAINLSQFAAAGKKQTYFPHERETVTLLNPDPDDGIFKRQPGWVYGELHRRFSEWLYPILFAMIGLVVAGQTQSHRQTRFNAFFLGLGGAMLYRWGAYAIYNASKSDPGAWWMFYALPVAGIALNALMFGFGLTVKVPDAVARHFIGLQSRLHSMRVRMARARTA